MTKVHQCPYFSLRAPFKDQSIPVRACAELQHATLPCQSLMWPGAMHWSEISVIVEAKCTAARVGWVKTAAPVTHRRGLSSHCPKRNGVCLFIYKPGRCLHACRWIRISHGLITSTMRLRFSNAWSFSFNLTVTFDIIQIQSTCKKKGKQGMFLYLDI